MATNCRVCLVLKHVGSYLVQIFVHMSALHVGGGGHSRSSESHIHVFVTPSQVYFRSGGKILRWLIAELSAPGNCKSQAVGLSQGQIRFVPGTIPGSSQGQPDQKVYVPFSRLKKKVARLFGGGFEKSQAIGRCPSTVRPMFPMLVFHLSKQQNRTWTTSSRGLTKGRFSKRVVSADVPPEQKPQRGYIRMFPRNKSRNEGTFACSPGTKTGTRAHSPKPPFYETGCSSPSDPQPYSEPL